MKTETYIKTYGVREGYHKGKKRFFVVLNGSKTSLHYAKRDKALKVSERFCKACHKNFMRSNGISVSFIFKLEGGIK